MAAGGLSKFIHGPQKGTNATPRKIPKKLVLDDANKVYSNTNDESSDTSTQRGAFSTDLGSYPDTSLEDIQDQSEPGSLHAAANPPGERQHNLVIYGSGKSVEADTVASTQQGAPVRPVDNAPPLITHDATVSSLIGVENIQEYEDFLQTWTAADVNKMPLVKNAPQNVPLFPTSSIQDAPIAPISAPSKTISSQRFQQSKTIQHPYRSVSIPQKQSNSEENIIPSSNNRELLFRPPGHRRVDAVFQSQTFPHTEGVPAKSSGSYDQSPGTESSNFAKRRVHANILSDDQHTKSFLLTDKKPTPDRWSLKRIATLDSLKLDISNQQLLSMQYSSLDEEDEKVEGRDNAAFFTDLDQVISGIVNQILDEETLLSRLSQLNHEEWTALGDKIQSKQGDCVSELKQLYTKKQDVSIHYEQETRDMIEQIESNDKIVSTKLQRLRSFGAQLLNDQGTTG